MQGLITECSGCGRRRFDGAVFRCARDVCAVGQRNQPSAAADHFDVETVRPGTPKMDRSARVKPGTGITGCRRTLSLNTLPKLLCALLVMVLYAIRCER